MWRSAAGSSGQRIRQRLLLVSVLAGVTLLPSVIQPSTAWAEGPGLATVVAETPLLAAPESSAAILASLGAGAEVVLSGSAAPGFLAVSLEGQIGWVDAGDLGFGDDVGIPLEDADEAARLLAAPLADAEVLGAVPAGGVVILTGANVGGYVAASYEGTGGWIAEAALGLPFDADHNAS